MKILMYATYLYDGKHKECSKNNTGYGHMVNDIAQSVGQIDEVYVITDKISKGFLGQGYYFLSHSVFDIIMNLHMNYLKQGINAFFFMKLSFKKRLRECFAYINKGAIKNTIKTINPDIIQIHGLISRTVPIIEICREMGIPYVLTLHGLNDSTNIKSATSYDKIAEKKYIRELCDDTIGISVVSSGIKRRIEKKYQLVNSDNISVISNGTNFCFQSMSNTKHRENKRFYITCIGNISKHKNQIQLVRAYKLLPENIKKSVVIDFFGEIIDQTINFEAEIYEYQSNIYYHGKVDRAVINQYLMGANLNILASKNEGFGLSIIEGYMCGVPAIFYSDIDAANDLFNMETSIMLTNHHDEALAQAIVTAYYRKWDREQIIEFGHHFSMNKMAQKYHHFFNSQIMLKNRGDQL